MLTRGALWHEKSADTRKVPIPEVLIAVIFGPCEQLLNREILFRHDGHGDTGEKSEKERKGTEQGVGEGESELGEILLLSRRGSVEISNSRHASYVMIRSRMSLGDDFCTEWNEDYCLHVRSK